MTTGAVYTCKLISEIERDKEAARYEAELRRKKKIARKRENLERQIYFGFQKAIGILMIMACLVFIISFWSIQSILIGGMGLIMGITFVLTRKLLIVNKFWYEHPLEHL